MVQDLPISDHGQTSKSTRSDHFPGEQQRIRSLDGIRGLAIFLVLLAHYIQNPLLTVDGQFPKYLAKFLSLTWSGVDLFFVLSGFLICGILIDNKESPGFFRTFYARRTCRIFPLYFVMLGLFILLSQAVTNPPPNVFNNAMPIWTYATFTQNWAMAHNPNGINYWLGITWSLAVEEQFYLVLPLVVYFTPRRALLPLFAFGIMGAVALRIWWPGDHAYVLTPWRADSLLAGSVLALSVRYTQFLDLVRQRKKILITLFGLLLGGAALMTVKPWSPWARNHLWIALLYAIFILVTLSNSIPVLNHVLTSAWLVWLGKVSYAVYLLHGPVASFLHWYLAGTGIELVTVAHIMTMFVALIITLCLAILSFKYLESPFLKLGQRFKYAPAASRSER